MPRFHLFMSWPAGLEARNERPKCRMLMSQHDAEFASTKKSDSPKAKGIEKMRRCRIHFKFCMDAAIA